MIKDDIVAAAKSLGCYQGASTVRLYHFVEMNEAILMPSRCTAERYDRDITPKHSGREASSFIYHSPRCSQRGRATSDGDSRGP